MELHGAVWETSGGDAGNEKAVAIRPANLRPCRVPMRRDTCIGCAGDRLLLRLLAGSDHLPDGIPQRIVDYLHIDPVSSVSVVAASSSSEQYELAAVLEAGSSCWWISASGTTPDGQGSEWLEFSFGDRARLVSFVGIRIPPLPQGKPSFICAFDPADPVHAPQARCQSGSSTCSTGLTTHVTVRPPVPLTIAERPVVHGFHPFQARSARWTGETCKSLLSLSAFRRAACGWCAHVARTPRQSASGCSRSNFDEAGVAMGLWWGGAHSPAHQISTETCSVLYLGVP